jgi:hypothetical protein
MTAANKPGRRGERGISRKTIARGMPGDSGVTVVTTLVCLFYFAREAAGASGARHSLRPLIFRGQEISAKLARTRGEIAGVCLGEYRCLKIESVVISRWPRGSRRAALPRSSP